MQWKLPSKKRRKMGDIIHGTTTPDEEATKPIDYTGALQQCYDSQIVPMMMQVETPGMWHRHTVHNEIEFGYSIGESQQSAHPPRVVSNILSGFLRRVTTDSDQRRPKRSLIYQLGTPSVQKLEDTLDSSLQIKDVFFSSDFDIIYENSIAFRVQQYQYVYVVSRRCCQRIDKKAVVTAYTEWKCKRKHAIGCTGEYIQLSAECVESDDNFNLSEAQSIIQHAIDIGVLPILMHEPHVHTALVITPRLIITWKQKKSYSWCTQLRLYMYGTTTAPCTMKPSLPVLFQYLSSQNVDHCMPELIRLSGFSTYQWRFEIEFSRIFTFAIFQAGFDAFCVIKDIILQISKHKIGPHQYTDDALCELQRLVPYEYTFMFLQYFLHQKPTRRVRSICSDDIPRNLRTACLHMTPSKSVDVILPSQKRPKDFTKHLYNTFHTNQLVCVKVDGVEAFLVGTSHSLVICMCMGLVCCVVTWTPEAPCPVPTPFIFEGEVFADHTDEQLLHFNCYDCLATPVQSCMAIAYEKRIKIMQYIIRIWKLDVCFLPFRLCVSSKPFLSHSMSPNFALKNCIRWAINNRIPCDGIIISSASANYWANNALKLKFQPTVDYYLHGKNPSIRRAGVYQLMLRADATRLVSVTKTNTGGHILPVCVTLPEYIEKDLNGRVIEISMEKDNNDGLCCTLSTIREVNKNPNYVQTAHDIVDNLMAVPYTNNSTDRLVVQAGGIQSVMSHIRQFKWQFFLDASFQWNQSPFVLIDIGGGNGGDVHKWLSIGTTNKNLREIVVIEPSSEAVQEYESRLNNLCMHHNCNRVWYTKSGCKLSILFGTLQSNLHALEEYHYIPIVFVFSFSITQVFEKLVDFDNFLQRFSHSDNKVVILMHSYTDSQIPTDSSTTHDVSWSNITNRRHNITISGTKLASGITETRFDAADLFEIGCTSGWRVRVRTWPVIYDKLHWLLRSLFGLVMSRKTTPCVLSRATAWNHTKSHDIQLLAALRLFVIGIHDRYKDEFVIVYYPLCRYFFVYRTMSASLYRYIGSTTIDNKNSPHSTYNFVVAPVNFEKHGREWLTTRVFLQSVGLRVSRLITNLNHIVKYDNSSD